MQKYLLNYTIILYPDQQLIFKLAFCIIFFIAPNTYTVARQLYMLDTDRLIKSPNLEGKCPNKTEQKGSTLGLSEIQATNPLLMHGIIHRQRVSLSQVSSSNFEHAQMRSFLKLKGKKSYYGRMDCKVK